MVQADEGLDDDVAGNGQHQTSKRNASTGGSLAARRAG
jgi:hypothetical protein